MKKLSIILIVLFTAVGASAQILPDSTVQICSNWAVGEQYDYYVDKSVKKVNSQGDTTTNELTSMIMRFEVTGKSESAYQMQLTYLDEKSTNQQTELIYQISRESGVNMPIRFTTSQHGTLMSIDNLEEIAAEYEKLLDPIIEISTANLTEAEKKTLDTSELREVLRAMLCNPQTIQTGILDDIGRLYFFHGARLEMDETYKMEEPLSFVFPGVDNITANTNIWVDGEFTDEYSAVCRTYTCAELGDEFLVDAVEGAMDMVTDAMAVPDSLKTQLKEEINSRTDKQSIGYQFILEQYTTEEVHLATGWPLNLYINKYIKAGTSAEETEETIERRSMEIILPDGNE